MTRPLEETAATRYAAWSQNRGRKGDFPVIHVSKLTKYYGDYPAVRDVSFDVPAGQVVGFLGPNGAGKTTTMRILTGFLTATSGEAAIDGMTYSGSRKKCA